MLSDGEWFYVSPYTWRLREDASCSVPVDHNHYTYWLSTSAIVNLLAEEAGVYLLYCTNTTLNPSLLMTSSGKAPAKNIKVCSIIHGSRCYLVRHPLQRCRKDFLIGGAQYVFVVQDI